MRIEITCQGKRDILVCPPETDFVGVSIANVCNINNGFPRTLGGTLVNCVEENKVLSDGTSFTAYLYEFSGDAKVLSLKEYAGLVCYDVSYGEVRVRVIV